MGRYVYLSFPLGAGTPLYGAAGQVTINPAKRIARGDSCNTDEWAFSNHAGTHVDAPNHFFDEGKTIEAYEAVFWVCTKVSVVHCPLGAPRWIVPADVEKKVAPQTECLLIKTGFERHRGREKYVLDNPGLSPELGKWLRANCTSLKFIGMDFISVSRFADRGKGREAHAEFLRPLPPGAPILPIEDMCLSPLKENDKVRTLRVFPLRVERANGAPVTVVAEME